MPSKLSLLARVTPAPGTFTFKSLGKITIYRSKQEVMLSPCELLPIRFHVEPLFISSYESPL